MTNLPASPFLSSASVQGVGEAAAPAACQAGAAVEIQVSPGGHCSSLPSGESEPAVTLAYLPGESHLSTGKLTPRERFRRDASNTLSDWHFGCIPPRSTGAEVAIFREAMADIIRFRLRIACMPLFQGLERIQHRVGILADLKREPWAPIGHEVNR